MIGHCAAVGRAFEFEEQRGERPFHLLKRADFLANVHEAIAWYFADGVARVALLESPGTGNNRRRW